MATPALLKVRSYRWILSGAGEVDHTAGSGRAAARHHPATPIDRVCAQVTGASQSSTRQVQDLERGSRAVGAQVQRAVRDIGGAAKRKRPADIDTAKDFNCSTAGYVPAQVMRVASSQA